jgi:hypothetical protein
MDVVDRLAQWAVVEIECRTGGNPYCSNSRSEKKRLCHLSHSGDHLWASAHRSEALSTSVAAGESVHFHRRAWQVCSAWCWNRHVLTRSLSPQLHSSGENLKARDQAADVLTRIISEFRKTSLRSRNALTKRTWLEKEAAVLRAVSLAVTLGRRTKISPRNEDLLLSIAAQHQFCS